MSYKKTSAMLLLAWAAVAQAGDAFPIKSFQVHGNTLLPAAEVDELLAPFVAEQADFGFIQRALERLEAAYRQRGYAAVQVRAPEQELTEGVVRLEVAEPYLGHVRLPEGLQFLDGDNLRHGLPGLREGEIPNARLVSQQVELNNENPAKQVEVVLGLGQQEGFVDARLKVEENDPLRFFAGIDNTGTRQTGSTRLNLGVQHANLFNRDHVATAALAFSPEKPESVAVGTLSYRLPLYEQGGVVDLIYGYSDVDAGSSATTAGPLSFSGRGSVAGLRYTQILPRQGEYSSRLTLGWEYRDYNNNCALGVFGAAGCAAAAADLVVKPLTLTYAGQRVAPGDAVEFALSLSSNLPGGNKGNDAAFALARPSPTGGRGAAAGYSVLRGNLSRLLALPDDWQVRTALNFQYSEQPLVVYEQLGLAGSQTIRGFLERAVTRDKGAFVNIELYTPEINRLLGWENGNLRALAFFDAGYGRNNLLAGETQPSSTLTSYGLGLRYALGKNLSARLDVARVVDGAGIRQAGDVRGHFSLMATY